LPRHAGIHPRDSVIDLLSNAGQSRLLAFPDASLHDGSALRQAPCHSPVGGEDLVASGRDIVVVISGSLRENEAELVDLGYRPGVRGYRLPVANEVDHHRGQQAGHRAGNSPDRETDRSHRRKQACRRLTAERQARRVRECVVAHE
jgi:hypothetical protein